MFNAIASMFKKRPANNIRDAFIESYARQSILEEEFIAQYVNSLLISRTTAVDLMLLVMMYGMHLAIASRTAKKIITSSDTQSFETNFFLAIIESVLKKAGDKREVGIVAKDIYGRVGILDSLAVNLPQGQENGIIEVAAKAILKMFADESSKDATEIYRVAASTANQMEGLIGVFDDLHQQGYSL